MSGTGGGTKRQGGGVADYFAILGIGDTLELKSTQKKYQRVSESQFGNSNDEAEKQKQKQALLEEEECGMVERFYREIVEVAIFTVLVDSNGDYLGGSLATSVKDEDDDDDDDYEGGGGGNLNRYSSSPSTCAGRSTVTTVTMNTNKRSPTMSSRKGIEAKQKHKNVLPNEISGFHILYETVSASDPGNPQGNANGNGYGNVNASICQSMSFGMDGGGDTTMLNQSMSFTTCHTFESKNGSGLWTKGQRFDADINPETGIRGTLLSTLKMPEDLLNVTMTNDNSFMNNQSFESIHTTNTIPERDQNQRGRFNVGVGQLSKRVGISKFISPMLASKARAMVDSSMDEGYGASHCRKRFYVGYRRRGADEINKPGVAECDIIFCRIHRSTVLPNKTLMASASAASANANTNTNTNVDVDEAEYGRDRESIGRGIRGAINAENAQKGAAALKRGLVSGAGLAKRVASTGRNRLLGNRGGGGADDKVKSNDSNNAGDAYVHPRDHQDASILQVNTFPDSDEDVKISIEPDVQYENVNLNDLIQLPAGFNEWVIPDAYQSIQLPIPPRPCHSPTRHSSPPRRRVQVQEGEPLTSSERRMQKTFLFSHRDSPTAGEAGIGVEAFVDGNTFLHPSPSRSNPGSPGRNVNKRNPWSPVEGPPQVFPPDQSMFPLSENNESICQDNVIVDRETLLPRLIGHESLPGVYDPMGGGDGEYEYVPLLAIRRQRTGEEERYKDDPSVVEIALTFSDLNGKAVMPLDEDFDFDENENDEEDPILGTSDWTAAASSSSAASDNAEDDEDADDRYLSFGLPTLVCQRNKPLGFLDTPFATSVLDRFPKKDYKGVPLPEEELPMFCYPTGCKLFRAQYQDAPLPEYYGFVVKNERGDNIHVSCVSFMEPLERSKIDQLNAMSERRRRTCLAHKFFCERQKDMNPIQDGGEKDKSSILLEFDDLANGTMLTSFDQMMTFEYKTICLISRYPFWSAFRRFLSHLHILSGSSYDLPLERYISHLLLTVPVPKPGGQCILIPLPAIASPMVLGLPPPKDLPLLDLPFRRLLSCLDAPTIVTIVLGFLALERKVIIMSAFPSLVSDVCELLRSLLFPFDLCAPYVPRLTEPFMSCLNFPGAIFVGIHDDGSNDGLASTVRSNIPEDSFIVDLDTGDIDCGGDRECWDIIPHQCRSHLVEEIETLCHDAGLNPGQEPANLEIEAALDISDVSFAPLCEDDDIEPLDDRAIRDAFLRFFCSVLGGYERFLLVPDIDFLVSGNEWFDAKGFIAATERQTRGAFLQSFVSTQLFQSFIQRRTEASDVHCLLFDECLNEYHSTQAPYGRLAASSENMSQDKGNFPPYELLVDQCAAELCNISEIDETSSAETSILTAHTIEGFMINNQGDLVTAPSKKNLPPGNRYVYCIDGHPHFPQALDTEMFYPKEPDHLSAEFDQIPVPILTRSDREIDVSNRRRKLAVSHRGVQRQRRCLFQLPKLMASHILNCWLMCIPSQVSQEFRSSDQQVTYLLRALGALRVLRSQHRIVPDEAGYRCLILACGRVDSDRRQDVVKLFGLLRSDGIFPSAVTLGQYTRAIAEGYSKQNSGKANSIISEVVRENTKPLHGDETVERLQNIHIPNILDFLDGNIVDLDDAGSRWRQGRETRRNEKNNDGENGSRKKDLNDLKQINASREQANIKQRFTRRNQNTWLPVSTSSSFSPHWKPSKPIDESFDLMSDFRFIALWSRTTTCSECSYVLLDEEIQAGWDDIEVENENSDEVKCPCCGNGVDPRLGYIEMPPHTPDISKKQADISTKDYTLPAQVQNNLSSDTEGNSDERLGYVPYLSPSKMRAQLEQIVNDFGEEVLEREKLRYLNPTVFFNLWWYCCRFSLPLPLAVSNEIPTGSDHGAPVYNNHCCAFAAWEKSISIAACHSAAKTVLSVQALIVKNTRPAPATGFQNLVKSFEKQQDEGTTEVDRSSQENGASIVQNHNPLQDDFPLLANLNFQSLGQRDWDNADLSAILVKLVEACDKRDFFPAVEAVLQCNADRRARYGREKNAEFECYRTLLYLSRYQCMSAFHKFFPTTSKACKGYHFWCPNATVSIFDRMFREALDRVRAKGVATPVHDISDVALGFRNVFGHII